MISEQKKFLKHKNAINIVKRTSFVRKKNTSKKSHHERPSSIEKQTFRYELPITKLFEQVYAEFVNRPLGSTYVKRYLQQKNYQKNHFIQQSQDVIISQVNKRKTQVTQSNWPKQNLIELITRVPLKTTSLVKELPLSTYLRNVNINLFSRPYNTKHTSLLHKLMQDYRAKVFLNRRPKQKQDRIKVSPFIRRLSEPFKKYKQDLRSIAVAYKNIVYAQSLGHSLGKTNPMFLPWVRKRGNTRTHFFRKRQHRLSIDERTPYTYLLRKRISRLIRPANLKLSKFLSREQRKSYVLSQISNYPIKTQNLFLKTPGYP